jgi:hypothetical protein
MNELVEAVKAHARDHYEDGGWDVLVECYSDSDIAGIVAGAKTAKGAIRKAAKRLGIAPAPKSKYGIYYNGVDGRASKSFKSLAELQAYVKDRWLGGE